MYIAGGHDLGGWGFSKLKIEITINKQCTNLTRKVLIIDAP